VQIELRDKDTFVLCGSINNKNFLAFKDIVTEMFCLKSTSAKEEYNVQGELAK
jgi:hypothetical protein